MLCPGLFWSSAAFAQASTPVPPQITSERYEFWECGDLDEYADELEDFFGQAELEDLAEISDDEFAALRPSQLRSLADDLFELADLMDGYDDVPKVAEMYHHHLITYYSLYGNMYNSMATGGVFGALAYTDLIEDANTDVQNAWNTAYTRCGETWSDEFPEGLENYAR
jgi:hypothetical protein